MQVGILKSNSTVISGAFFEMSTQLVWWLDQGSNSGYDGQSFSGLRGLPR